MHMFILVKIYTWMVKLSSLGVFWSIFVLVWGFVCFVLVVLFCVFCVSGGIFLFVSLWFFVV